MMTRTRKAATSVQSAPSADSRICPAVEMQRYIDMGYVMPGWTAAGWRGELLRRAERCRKIKPDLAKLYERWAGKIGEKLGADGMAYRL